MNFAELIYQVAIKEMQTLRSQTIKMNNLANNLQIMKEYTMTSSLKNTMKSMEQPKKYYWSCKCSSFWHKLLEVKFIEFVRSVAEDLGIDGDNWDRLNEMGRSAAEDFQSPQNEQQ